MSASQSKTVSKRGVSSACIAFVLCACGGESGNTPSNELSASETASESAPAANDQAGAKAASAGSQAQPPKSTSNTVAGSGAVSNTSHQAAGAGGASAQPSPARAGAGGSSTAPNISAGSAGNPGAAGASAAAGSGAAPAASCDRACLTGFNDAYLDALIAKDASKLKTAASVRFTENGKELKLNEGLWAVASELGPYRQDMAEVPAGQTAGFVSLQDDRGDVLLAFRLKVVNMEVTEIETTVCRSGEASFFSPNALMRNPIYDKEVAADARMDRDAIIKIVDSYFAGIESSDGSAIPFAETARRNENGANTGSGTGLKNVAMFSYIDKIDRRYVLVDVERGNVLPWVLFQIPMSPLGGSRTLHLAELFKVEGGKIMDVQAIMVNQPLGTPGGWE